MTRRPQPMTQPEGKPLRHGDEPGKVDTVTQYWEPVPVKPTGRYQADYWYRHESDADRSVRDVPQMMAPVDDATAPALEIQRLQARGYTVQKVELYALCARCDGAGRVGKRPKGVHKATVLPSWRLVWVTCPVCKGQPKYARLQIYPVREIPA